MEFNMLSICVAILFSTLFAYSFFIFSKRRNNKLKLPPNAPGWWPIVGHLHLFAHQKRPPHETLAKMAEKTGPIFTIKLGSHEVLVVNTWELAKQCFTTNDKAFADRPKAIAKEIFGYNYSMFGFSPYGEYWRQIRKIVSIELLSNQQVDKLKYVVEAEVKQAIRDLYAKSTNSGNFSLELQSWVRDVMMNLILRIVVSRRYPSEWENVMRDVFSFLGNNFAVSDAIPWLRWLDIGGDERQMRKIMKVIDCTMSQWLEEHQERKRNKLKEDEDEDEDQDFMDKLLSTLKDDHLVTAVYDTDTITKATCLLLILGGSEPTSATIISALCLLLNNRNVLEKVKNEIDSVVGRDRVVNESDAKRLVYVDAIIKETLRLYPPSPLVSPRQSIEDCVLDGYHISQGTHLVVNLWKIHRDPRIWEDANKFQPERFLTVNKDIDVKGQNYMLIPFGSGRRICSGLSFSLEVVNLLLASLLQAFDIEIASGEPIHMNYVSTPINVVLIPRLHPHLYY